MQPTKLNTVAIIIASFFAFNSLLLANVVLPSGGKDGSFWRPNSVQHISWDVLFVDTTKNLNIYLWNADSSTLTLIGSNIISSTGSYNWHIPNNQVLGENFKIRIAYSDTTSNFYLMSKDFFPISTEEMVLSNNVFVATEPTVSITVSPHPTQSGNTITVSSDSKFFHIDIYNLVGNLINSYTFNYTNDYSISLQNLSIGTYILRVKFLGKTVDKQIIVD